MSLQSTLPWTKSPLIINAPMGGIAGPDLAIAVSLAGGVGMIGLVDDMSQLDPQLAQVEKALPRTHDNQLLPIGVGLLPFILDNLPAAQAELFAALDRYRPAIVWLFAARHLPDYATWTVRIRAATPKSTIWIQVGGSVSNALTVAQQCRPDAICIQGSDAGGHGFAQGASVMSFLPEVADALHRAGLGDIPLLASGGIADSRSAAAAFALGAQGVVMGTRFLAASETVLHPTYRAAVLEARDGGVSTAKTMLFDELRGPTIWPEGYDGRAIGNESWSDHVHGVPMKEIRARYAEVAKGEGKGYGWGGDGRAAMWAGTGVGFANKQQAAGEIVEEVRGGVVQGLERARARLSSI